MNEQESLEDLFERYESLPSQDAEQTKRELVDQILAAVAERLGADPDDERYRPVRDAAARLRLLSPEAAGFDDAVLDLIDAARDAFGDDPIANVVPVRRVERPGARDGDDDVVTEASEESFPASDPPGYAAGGDAKR